MTREVNYYFRDGTGGEEALFAIFERLPRGRMFYLAVADTMADDTGSVQGWAIYTRIPATAPRF